MGVTDIHKLSQFIKEQAATLGFSYCGFSAAAFLKEDAGRLHAWLDNGFHGEMQYMENHREKRLDPSLLVDGARSVISVLYNYYPKRILSQDNNYKISKYAYGRDYHYVIREKLKALMDIISNEAGDCHSRGFTDSAPVLERSWANTSGLGWIGKNSCLINPSVGSFFFIGEIITDLELQYDNTSMNDYCGGCTKCIDSCPTGAIVAPRVIDSRKCISYLTIEHKSGLPEGLRERFEDWIFGCDICQDVCPWNKKAIPHEEPQFDPGDALMTMHKKDWESLSKQEFEHLFKDSAIQRAGYDGLMNCINFVKENNTGKTIT